jgi:hypothetical protein
MWVVYEMDDETGLPLKIAGPFEDEDEANDYRIKSGGDGVLELNPPVESHQG